MGRVNVHLEVGSIWTPNDPRRWDRAVTVVGRTSDRVLVRPRVGPDRTMPTHLFYLTGHHGYTRLR